MQGEPLKRSRSLLSTCMLPLALFLAAVAVRAGVATPEDAATTSHSVIITHVADRSASPDLGTIQVVATPGLLCAPAAGKLAAARSPLAISGGSTAFTGLKVTSV